MKKFNSKKIFAGSGIFLTASSLVGTQCTVNSSAVFDINDWWLYVAIMRFIFGEGWSKQKFKNKLIDEFKRKNSEKFEGVKFVCNFDDQRNTCKVDFDFDGKIKLPLEFEFFIEEDFESSNEAGKVNSVKVRCENLDYENKESTFYNFYDDGDLEKMYKRVNEWHDSVEQDLKLLNQLGVDCGFERLEDSLSDGEIDFLVSDVKHKVRRKAKRNVHEGWIKKIKYDSYIRVVFVYDEKGRTLFWYNLTKAGEGRCGDLGYKDFKDFVSGLKEHNVIDVIKVGGENELKFGKEELVPLENTNVLEVSG